VSPRRRTRSRRRRGASRATGGLQGIFGGRFFVVLALGTLALAWLGIEEGPKIARQVWSLIGVRRVEGFADVLRAAGAESGVDPCLLAGVMYVESRGQVDSVSPKDARGLFQLLPAAAGDSARRLGLPAPSADDLVRDPRLNTRLGACHLAWLIRTDGPDLERVLVGYNAGRGKLARWEKDAGGWQAWRAQQFVRDTSGAFTYAQDVLGFAQRFRERGKIVLPQLPARPSSQESAMPSAAGAPAAPGDR
jgi:soluble lytic murein transglycosylase-like protein